MKLLPGPVNARPYLNALAPTRDMHYFGIPAGFQHWEGDGDGNSSWILAQWRGWSHGKASAATCSNQAHKSPARHELLHLFAQSSGEQSPRAAHGRRHQLCEGDGLSPCSTSASAAAAAAQPCPGTRPLSYSHRGQLKIIKELFLFLMEFILICT